MKRLLLIFALLMAFAVPAFAAEPKVTNWGGGGVDPTLFDAADNWSNGVPATGDTVQFIDGGALPLPSVNMPNAGEVFVLVIDGAQEGTAWNQDLTDFCGGGDWDYSSLTVGAEGRITDILVLDKDSAVGGTIDIWGTVTDDGVPTPIANAIVTVKAGDELLCGTAGWTFTQPITVETGGYLTAYGCTLLANGGINLAGTLDIASPTSILDVGTAPINCTGDCTILWGNGNGDIFGGLDSNGHTVTHTGTASGNDLVCDQPGDLELGGSAAGLAVTVSAAVNLNGDMIIRTLSTGANVTCAAPRTATVGAGGYTMTNGTLTGTLGVNLSGGAGAYTQTAGTIAEAAVLNVTTGTGAVTFVALTKTGSGALNVTMAESANIGWNAGVASAATNRISLLTVNSGKTATLTADVDVSALAGSGTVATSSGKDLRAAFLGDNFWTFTGSVTGAGRVWFYAWANTSNAAAITVANSSTTNLEGGNGLSCTLSGRLTTSGALNVNGTGGSNVVTWTLNGGSNIGGAVTVGSTTQSGILVFGPSQVHVLASTLAMSGTGVSNAVTIGGRLILGGTMTGTGIVVAVAGDGEIDCGGTARVTATTVTGRRLVVRRAVDAAGMPLRSWEGGASNVNIMFKGRKEIGAPGVN